MDRRRVAALTYIHEQARESRLGIGLRIGLAFIDILYLLTSHKRTTIVSQSSPLVFSLVSFPQFPRLSFLVSVSLSVQFPQSLVSLLVFPAELSLVSTDSFFPATVNTSRARHPAYSHEIDT